MKHECAATNCDTQINMALLMCSVHWFRVPPDLRRQLVGRYHRWQRSTLPPAEVVELRRIYLETRELCIQAVDQFEARGSGA